jgi:hypothetical protein
MARISRANLNQPCRDSGIPRVSQPAGPLVLLWAIAPDETNAQYLANANFIPLPAHVWVLSHDQIEEIK